ncbi:MAG: hypothetical protein IMF19_05720 [Proteobacteria bacterium]|nr:hypothetical protein [Pseudomonadota bacterium]
MFVIVYGDLFDGIQGIVGPFETENAARKCLESSQFDYNYFSWSITKLAPPNHE